MTSSITLQNVLDRLEILTSAVLSNKQTLRILINLNTDSGRT